MSYEEIAKAMDTTVPAVKAALVRGRAALRASEAAATTADTTSRAQLDSYARLFNARDWDGVRALIGEDCRLDLVSKSQRRGKAVGMYFGNYARENVRLEVTQLDGRDVLKVEYYPAALFDDRRMAERRRDDPVERQARRLMSKVSLVTLWIDPEAIISRAARVKAGIVFPHGR